MMKKAWLIFVCSCGLFWGIKEIVPKEFMDSFFIENKDDNSFGELLNEQLQDTIDQQHIADSLALIEKEKKLAVALKEKKKNDSIQKLIQYKKVNRDGLNHFFSQLRKLEKNKSKQVRIAFFGDSMEDADMIVMHLRHFLQQKFGGKGVGFVPITSVTASGRYSIKHSFSNHWKNTNFMKKGYGYFPFGLNGKSFYVGDTINEKQASVTFKKGSAYKELPLINPTLFYGQNRINDSINYTPSLIYTSKSKTDTIELKNKKSLLKHYTLPNLQNKITLTFKDKQTTPFYGVSFASKNGVIVDNLSVRGNSGLPIGKLNSGLMQEFNKHFNYDLIILAYGTNVFSFDNEKYGWYRSRMLRNIKHIQKCFPKADILICSMGDRSTKIEGEMQTPKHLPDFINLQYSIAKKSNSGFYNLYEQMGGLNSMVKWVEKDNLANKDYTHFKPEGARKAGNMFYKWMMKHYKENIKKIKPKKPQQKNNA